MAGGRISGLTKSMFTSRGGRPVVPDTSFSQPVSCSEPALKSGLALSESNRFLNINPTPITQVIPLQPTYDLDVPLHLNKELNHCLQHEAPVVTPPPFLEFDYMGWYPTFLDVVCFCGCGLMARNSKCGPVLASVVIRL